MTEQAPIIIQQFKLSDLDQVIEINRDCLPENYPERFFRSIYAELPSAFVVAKINENIIGYTMARIETGFSSFSLLHRARKGHTVSIAVLEGYRRKGVGRRILKKSMDAMINQGATELFLEVRVSNTPAVELYKSMGYKILKEIPRYYRDLESAYLMAKKIGTN
ncbi:MAG: ribosomal protein S18-alanine N-acetyltransferase [Candidatus Hodarchaeales archaeon]